MKAYCISGLGADFRMFQGIEIQGCQLEGLGWIAYEENESLESYALRLADGIDTSQPFWLIGLSFGGMLATEIAKVHKPERLIIISSAMVRSDIPKLYLLFGPSVLKSIPDSLFTNVNGAVYLAFGAKSEEQKRRLRRAIEQTDKGFFRWAMGAILKWRNKTEVPAVRIHGTVDKILPAKKEKVDLMLKGGHLAILPHSKEINAYLNQ